MSHPQLPLALKFVGGEGVKVQWSPWKCRGLKAQGLGVLWAKTKPKREAILLIKWGGKAPSIFLCIGLTQLRSLATWHFVMTWMHHRLLPPCVVPAERAL